MATSILMDLIKTDFSQKQKDFEPKYTTKDTSDMFTKIFENTNKSYNFNSEKMERISDTNRQENYLKGFSSFAEQHNPSFENHLSSNQNYYNHNQHSQNSYNYQENNSPAAEKDYEQRQTVYTDSDRSGDKQFNAYNSKEIQGNSVDSSIKSEKTENKQPQETLAGSDKSTGADKNTEVKDTTQSAGNEKAEENGEKAATAQSNENAQKNNSENNKSKGQKAENQLQQNNRSESAKDTAGKLLLEKAKTDDKTAKIAEKSEEKTPKVEAKADDKTAKITEKSEEKTAKVEVKADDKTVKIAEKSEEKTAKTENPREPEKEKEGKEKADFREPVNNRVQNERTRDDNKTALPPHSRHLEAKEDLKIENVRVSNNFQAQKSTNEFMNMNKQGQQNFGQESKTGSNINQATSSDSGAQKVDLQKTAQFEKVLNSKQAETTQKSVLNQVKNASAQLGSNKSEVSINLKPDNLGKLNINLTSQKGEVTAQITVENQQVKDMLTKGLEGLRQHLSDQGVNANRVTINVQQNSEGETDFDQANMFDEDGNSPETNAESEKEGNLAEDNQDGIEADSTYGFEQEEEGSDRPIHRNIIGNVDYKV